MAHQDIVASNNRKRIDYAKIIERVRINVADVRTFGTKFLTRHSARLLGRSTAQINIPDVGSMEVRVDGSDVDVVRQMFQQQQYDAPFATSQLARKYSEILAAGKLPLIVDAGANTGASTLWFKHRYPEAFIAAIEPESDNFDLLKRNVSGKPGVTIFKAAIGAEKGFVTVSGVGMWARTEKSEQGVPVITMPEVLEGVPKSVPFIVKIDIEGFESELFLKNTEWLDGVFAVFIELHDCYFPGDKISRSFQRAIAQHDFEISLSGATFIYVRI
jgi:FkbM family methyltransferase